MELPPKLEAYLRKDNSNFDRDALVAVALDLFRREKIGVSVLGQMLGMNRFEANRFLIERGETAQMLTMEDLEGDYQRLRAAFAAESTAAAAASRALTSFSVVGRSIR